MVTVKEIFQRIIKEDAIEKELAKKELAELPSQITKLKQVMRYDKPRIYKAFNVKLDHPHTYKNKLTIRLLHSEGLGSLTELKHYERKLNGIYAIYKREDTLLQRIEEIAILRKSRHYFTMVVRLFFIEMLREVVRGETVNVGYNLKFKMVWQTIDNADGKSRMNFPASNKKRIDLLEKGIPVQNHRAGQYGEKWVVRHDNIVDLSSLRFTKFKSKISTIGWYRLVLTDGGLGHTQIDGSKTYDDIDISTVDKLIDSKVSVHRKIRLLDSRFPNHKYDNFKHINYKN